MKCSLCKKNENVDMLRIGGKWVYFCYPCMLLAMEEFWNRRKEDEK